MDSIDHIAIQVSDINKAVKSYTDKFDCEVIYIDTTWAMLKFDNINLALVIPTEHPPHIAFIDHNVKEGVIHRDGSEAKYEDDGFGNTIEKIKYKK